MTGKEKCFFVGSDDKERLCSREMKKRERETEQEGERKKRGKEGDRGGEDRPREE